MFKISMMNHYVTAVVSVSKQFERWSKDRCLYVRSAKAVSSVDSLLNEPTQLKCAFSVSVSVSAAVTSPVAVTVPFLISVSVSVSIAAPVAVAVAVP